MQETFCDKVNFWTHLPLSARWRFSNQINQLVCLIHWHMSFHFRSRVGKSRNWKTFLWQLSVNPNSWFVSHSTLLWLYFYLTFYCFRHFVVQNFYGEYFCSKLFRFSKRILVGVFPSSAFISLHVHIASWAQFWFEKSFQLNELLFSCTLRFLIHLKFASIRGTLIPFGEEMLRKNLKIISSTFAIPSDSVAQNIFLTILRNPFHFILRISADLFIHKEYFYCLKKK